MNQQKPATPFQPWLVTLGAALFFFFVFFQLCMFNSISTNLMKSFNISATHLGYLSSSYFFADALFIIPAGIILDRCSIRNVALIVMTLCVLATFGLAMTHNYHIAMFCRAVTGAGNAFAFLASMQLASRWLPAKRLALGIGLVITVIMIGGIIAQTPLTLLVGWVHWREATVINGVVGIAFLIYMFRFLADMPGEKYHRPQHINTKLLTNLIASMRNKQNWFCASFTGLLNLPIALLGELWGVMYLKQAQHLSATTASSVAGMMFFGMIIGSPLMGFLSDKIGMRRRPMIMSSIALIAVILVIAYTGAHSAIMLGGLFFLLGFLASAQVLSYPIIAESNPHTITGTSMSIVAIMLNLFSFIAQPLYGYLMHLGVHTHQHVEGNYTAGHFAIAMILLPAAFVAALLICFKVKETFCRPYSSAHTETNNTHQAPSLQTS